MHPTDPLDEEIGLDADALVYEMDHLTGFKLEDGTKLQGQALIDHLIHSNDLLKDKVKLYRNKCNNFQEDIYDEKKMCYKKLQNVRDFYQNMYCGNSRGATMLKMVL